MAPRRKYHVVDGNGEWIAPKQRGFKDACCDCGLVHHMDFRVVDGQIQFKAVRDERATAAMRRAFRFTKD